MERSFIASKESKYVQDWDKYLEFREQQNEVVKEFCVEKGIEANCYRVGGNGSVNKPFSNYNEKEIGFDIEATENDLVKFGKMLCKPMSNGLCSFRKNSTISKEFAQKCVEKQIVINLHSPEMRHYFKTLGFNGYTRSQFPIGDNLYVKVASEYLKEEDIPEGFTEIKLSEYYIAEEKLDKEEN